MLVWKQGVLLRIGESVGLLCEYHRTIARHHFGLGHASTTTTINGRVEHGHPNEDNKRDRAGEGRKGWDSWRQEWTAEKWMGC